MAGSFSNMRLGTTTDGTRIVLDSPIKLKVSVFSGDYGKALIINLHNALITANTQEAQKNIQSITTDALSSNKSQIIMKFQTPVKISREFSLNPTKENPLYRYVIDTTCATDAIEKKSMQQAIRISQKKTIIIDAGHGGKDPGTIGYSKTREKDVTLRCAKILAAELQKNKHYKVILTRDRDTFIPLGQRVKIGRLQKGDLFISLHADSAPNKKARGLSIYTLSKTASDKEAERLAAKENKADFFSGMGLDAEIPEVASILIDLTKRETMNMSITFAQTLKRELQSRISLLDNTHRFANFAVLRTPDIPAVLIELGYLSNPDDEKMLKSNHYLKKVAEGIRKAIDAFEKEQQRP